MVASALVVERTRRTPLSVLAVIALAAAVSPTVRTSHASENRTPTSVIVRATPASLGVVEHAVLSAGGSLSLPLPLISGFSATIPASAIPLLVNTPGVLAVTDDASGQMLSTATPGDDPLGSMSYTESHIGATSYTNHGRFTGDGIDVALIDTGVAPVSGLDAPGKIIFGPDISFDSQNASTQYLDAYGHGTFEAGIIAGNDGQGFTGIAPGASIVSVKVGAADGSVDVSQIIAGIDWVVQHQHDNGLNIKVINLAFGTNSQQKYVLDPLAYAAEQAWHHGIVVVVAAGNNGDDSAAPGLDDPAYDPYLIAVGASASSAGSESSDSVTSFSSRGDGVRNPDLVAPGQSIISLRDPGSYIDDTYGSTGRVGDTYFKGTGTSEATAMVSGAVALIEQQHPGITPDQVKALLTSNATSLAPANPQAEGAGEINLSATYSAPVRDAFQLHIPSIGVGSLDASRGTSDRVTDSAGNTLTGEIDILGNHVNTTILALQELLGRAWTGGDFNGAAWAGSTWSDKTWKYPDGTSYQATIWQGHGWQGHGWAGHGWQGHGWQGHGWQGHGWQGHGWAGHGWAGHGWAGHGWAGHGWSTELWE